MPKSLQWIIVLAVGWEPVEDKKADFIYEVLEMNPPSIYIEGFSYIPEQYISLDYLNSLNQTNASATLSTFLSVPYLEEESLVGYIKKRLKTIFEYGEYDIGCERYVHPGANTEGFVVLLSPIEQEKPIAPRKMVQQVKGVDGRSAYRQRKILSPIPRQPVNFPTQTAPSPEEKGSQEPTRVAYNLPPFQNRPTKQKIVFTPEENESVPYPKLEQTQKAPEPAPAPAPENEWDSFIGELDNVLSGSPEEEQQTARKQEVSPSVPTVPTVKKPEGPAAAFTKSMDRAPKIGSPRSKAHIPQMYMNLQQEEEEKKSEFADWDNFLEGLDSELGSASPETPKQPAAPQKTVVEKEAVFDNAYAQPKDDKSESKVFQGRGLILTPEEVALENAVKKIQSGDKPKTPHPLGHAPKPISPELMKTQRKPMGDFKPPTPIPGKPSTPPPAQMTAVQPVPNQAEEFVRMAPPMPPVPMQSTHQEVYQGVMHPGMPQYGVPHPPVSQTPTGYGRGTPSPMYKKPPTPPPLMAANVNANLGVPVAHEHPHHAPKGKKTAKKSWGKRFLVLLAILGSITGGGYLWYLNGGKETIDPYLTRIKTIYGKIKKAFEEEKADDAAAKHDVYTIEYQKILAETQKDPHTVQNLKKLTAFILKIEPIANAASVVKIAQKQKEKAIEVTRDHLKLKVEQMVGEEKFGETIQFMEAYKDIPELTALLNYLRDRTRHSAQNALEKTFKTIEPKIIERNFLEASRDFEEGVKNQIPEIRNEVENLKGNLLKPFATKYRDEQKFMWGIKYLLDFLKTDANHSAFKTKEYIVWLVQHHVVSCTSRYKYDEAAQALERYEKIKIDTVNAFVRQFMGEVETEREFLAQVKRGIESFREKDQVLTFEIVSNNKVNPIRGKIMSYEEPNLSILSTKKLTQNINSLGPNTLKTFLNRGKTKSLSEESQSHSLGIYFFSQQRFEEAKVEFGKANRMTDFVNKLRYYK